MGVRFSSKARGPKESDALVSYDNREAIQYTTSDFVEPCRLVNKLMPGDMIQKKGNFIYQWFYSHFAIYIGNGEIVHVTRTKRNEHGKIFVQRQLMNEVFKHALVRKNNHLDNVPGFRNMIKQPLKIVKAARDKVGESWNYNITTHNCEHFATWCTAEKLVFSHGALGTWYLGRFPWGNT